jgi:hypothetical protein
MRTFLIAASSFCIGALLMYVYLATRDKPAESGALPVAGKYEKPAAAPLANAATPAAVSAIPPSAANSPSVTHIAAPSAPASAGTASLRAEAATMLTQWAAAWSARDVDRYLGFYSQEFVPPENLKRAAWESQRRSRILGKSKIAVGVQDVTVEMLSDNRAMARFSQNYEADKISELGKQKMMVLAREGGTWRIAEELNARGKPAAKRR